MDVQAKKKTLRMFSNGMYILTSRDGDRFGAATVTWVSQASFKPPLVMAAVRTDSNAYRCLSESRIAAIHVLGHDQQSLAQRFFARTQANGGCINDEPFVEGKTSVPVLQSPPAYLECRVLQVLEGFGDHAIVILEVVEAECRQERPPLTIAQSPWEYSG